MAHQGFLGEDLKDVVARAQSDNPLSPREFQGNRNLPSTGLNPPVGITQGEVFRTPQESAGRVFPTPEPQQPSQPPQPTLDNPEVQILFSSSLLREPKKRKAVADSIQKTIKDADEGGSGFKFTDIFNLVGALASDPNIAANSIGRAFQRAGFGEFRSPEERKQAQQLQKQQAQQALGLLLEQGRSKRAENRNNMTSANFKVNTALREQEIEISAERLTGTQNKDERNRLKDAGKDNQLIDSLLAGANKTGFLGSTGFKEIAKGLPQLTETAAKVHIADLKKIPEGPERTTAAESLVQRLRAGEKNARVIVRPTPAQARAELERRQQQGR